MWSAGMEKYDLALHFLSTPQRSFTSLFWFIWISASLLSSAAERAAGEHSGACGTDPTQSGTQSENEYATALICVRCINEYPGRRWRLNQSDRLVNETQNVFSELNCTQVYEATSELLVSWFVSCPWTDYTMRAVLYWVSSGWSFRPNIASVSFTLETVGTCHQHLVKCFHPHRFYKV